MTSPTPARAPARARARSGAALAILLLLSACTDDPLYLHPPAALELGLDPEQTSATVSLTLPVRLERPDEATARAARAAELGAIVPYVTVDDLDLELEWTLRNLADAPAQARIQVDGASELYAYAPATLIVDPEEEEAPPSLMGDVPLALPPLGTVAGVFREDEVAEASLDLELMTRGGLSPFTAVLAVDEARRDFVDAGGVTIPRSAWASMIRFDLTLLADQHVVLEYAVRIRDHRDPELVHARLLEAPAGELATFAPAPVPLPELPP